MSNLSSPTLAPTSDPSKEPSILTHPAMSGTATPATPAEPELQTEKPVETHNDHVHPLAQLGQVRKNFLLLVFAVATFLDICNVAGVGLAATQIRADIDLEFSQLAWIITSYSLCFAALLLFAGRLADLFPANLLFLGGFVGLGVFSLITSFVTNNKYGFLILRGLGGLCGALTIPSSYHLLIHMFPNPDEQQKKLALLGMAGGLGNVLGLVIAGLTMLASYVWFFRVIAFACFVFSALGIWLLPHSPAPATTEPKWKRLDLPGVILMMGFLICFILALTNGPINGWGSANFIAPFIIAFACAFGFFLWERAIPARTAVLPSSVYQIKNFITSSLVIMMPLSFWFTSQLYYATYWQLAFGWKPLHVAAAILPQAIVGLLIGVTTQFVPQIVSKPIIFIPIGALLMIAGQLLQIYSYGGQGYDYWRLVFPGFVLGSAGAMIAYFGSAISVLVYSPPEMSGVISAWTQVVAQVGGAIALAVQAAFESEDLADWMKSAGRTFWFMVAWTAVLGLQYVIFWRKPGTPLEEHALARKRIEESGKDAGVATNAA